MDCQFCLTALLGIKRNLTAGEIVGQVCAVLNDQHVSLPLHRINLVFMGMGEPFLNYGNFMKAVHLLVEGVGITESRMTVSTAGIVPAIYDFGLEPVRPKIAISLNASNDELRTRLMPINRKWNLEKLMAAARRISAAQPGKADVRIRAAGRSQRLRRECPRSGGVDSRLAGETESDRAESRTRN